MSSATSWRRVRGMDFMIVPARRWMTGHALVPVRAEAQITGVAHAIFLVEIEEDPLALPKHAKHRAVERTGPELNLGLVLEEDHTYSRRRVVHLDDALHPIRPSRSCPP